MFNFIKGTREKYYNEGIINEDHIFTQDVLFNSKSGAASAILGHSANGNVFWVLQNNLNPSTN